MWINMATTGSLQDGAQTRSDLKLGCMQWAGKVAPKACSEPHDAEFVATLAAPDVPKEMGDRVIRCFLVVEGNR